MPIRKTNPEEKDRKPEAVLDIPLFCPYCHNLVPEPSLEAEAQWVCPKVQRQWPVKNYAPWLVDKNLEFKGFWAKILSIGKAKALFSGIVHRNIQWGVPHLFKPLFERISGRPLDILDIGCGAEWDFLKGYGQVTRVEVSPAVLGADTSAYDKIIRACPWRLPFPDNTFDVATSIWLVEHLREPEFTRLLKEVRRVLRRDGHFIFVADLYSSKPILRWARSYPAEFQKYHIERVGHYGLRSLRYTRHCLQRVGYEEQKTIPINKSSVLQPLTALWMFDNVLGRKSGLLRLYTTICRLVLKRLTVHRIIYNLLMEYHRLTDRHLPDYCAFSALFDWKPKFPHEEQRLPNIEFQESSTRKPGHLPLPSSRLRSSAVRSRRPVAVMVDNVPQAFPQIGLARASVVFQAPIEGLRTRLMAIYTESLPSMVGPVRSTRPYFMDWAGAFQPFFIHCGASPQAREQLRDPQNLIGVELWYHLEEGVSRPIPVRNAEVTRLDLSRKSPHFVFALPGAVFEKPEALSVTTPDSLRSGGQLSLTDLVNCQRKKDHYLQHSHVSKVGSKYTCCVEVRPQPGADLGERFRWDSSAMGFRREALRRNRVIPESRLSNFVIRNLIVVETYLENIPNDLRRRLRIRTCGDGPGCVWCGESSIDVTWQKLKPDQPMEFLDRKGENVLLLPGLTWICILGPSGNVQVKR